ncbi:hypothetical protein HBI38_116450 [Parastagonospora nodorum]|nr:hypothetical protein HBI73_089100 [Parastagonospora nodorum]KAH5418241.1 hypothetical protein HBI32_106680 [Parastagonospora nodorum]KAH6267831.1 hypothetical protein HBI41_098570 [Parastagonospora nodorum]KAH6320061.1 hypothetical protein HBI38_116450 [Parastagonospora nodorum]
MMIKNKHVESTSAVDELPESCDGETDQGINNSSAMASVGLRHRVAGPRSHVKLARHHFEQLNPLRHESSVCVRLLHSDAGEADLRAVKVESRHCLSAPNSICRTPRQHQNGLSCSRNERLVVDFDSIRQREHRRLSFWNSPCSSEATMWHLVES